MKVSSSREPSAVFSAHVEDCLQLPGVLLVEEARLLARRLGPAPAEVIAPSLDQHRTKFQTRGPPQKGQVLADELLLEVDGVGRDDHPLLVGLGPEQCRDQIGEALAGPRPRLDRRQPSPVEGLADGESHAQLLGALLEAGKRPRHHSAGTEDGVDALGLDRHLLAGRESLHHLVEPLGQIVDDVEADPQGAEPRGDLRGRRPKAGALPRGGCG